MRTTRRNSFLQSNWWTDGGVEVSGRSRVDCSQLLHFVKLFFCGHRCPRDRSRCRVVRHHLERIFFAPLELVRAYRGEPLMKCS